MIIGGRSVGMAESVLQCAHHLRNAIDDLVLARKPRIHLTPQLLQTVLEVLERLIVELLVELPLRTQLGLRVLLQLPDLQVPVVSLLLQVLLQKEQ